MKKYLLLVLILLQIACKNNQSTSVVAPTPVSVAAGKQLFETNNCNACHQIAEKVVGPSLQTIAQIYKAKNANIISFLKAEAEPIVDPSQYASMKLNLEITKTMSNNEIKSLELYILSQAKQ